MISSKVSRLALLFALSTGASLTYANQQSINQDSVLNDEFLSEEVETNYRSNRSTAGSNSGTDNLDARSESRPGSEERMQNQSADSRSLAGSRAGDTADTNMIHFDFDSAGVTSEAQQNLQAVVEKVQNEPNPVVVEISGFTDATGPEEYNKDLAERRAKAVKEYLSEQNVEVKEWEIQALGEEQPIASNDSPQGRRENRRVEIQVVNAPD